METSRVRPRAVNPRRGFFQPISSLVDFVWKSSPCFPTAFAGADWNQTCRTSWPLWEDWEGINFQRLQLLVTLTKMFRFRLCVYKDAWVGLLH